MSMQKRMMIYFAVPLLIIQTAVAAVFYPVLLEKYKNQLDYSREQSVSQAVSFVGSYIHNMEYLAQMVENNGEIHDILSAKEFNGARNLDDQYREFYTLNKAFASLEFSNSLYRFGLYISEDIVYVSNQYYIFPDTRLIMRDDYERMTEYFAMGRDYLAHSEERKDVGSMDTYSMLTLYHQIRDSSGENVLGVCSISIDGERLVQVMENANITSNGLVYLVNAEGEGAVSSNADLFERIGEQASFLLTKGEQAWESVRVGRTVYYADREPIEDTGWQLVALIPESEYNGQFRGLVLSAAVAVVVMMIMIMGASYFLSNYYVGRLKKLSMEMQHLQEGDLNVQLPSIQQGDEVEEVYRNFNFMVGEVRRLLREHFQLGKDARVAELRVLQAQINPHFLYNALDTINWMARKEEKEDICEMVSAVSNLLRISISNKETMFTLDKELDYVKDYLYIQQTRYRARFEAMFEIDERIRSQRIPKLTIQPLVENAIVHSVEVRKEKTELTIRAYRMKENVYIEIEDTGIGMSERTLENLLRPQKEKVNVKNAHTGLGVYAVHQRIQYMFGEAYGLKVYSEEGKGTRVVICFPYKA